LEILSFVFFPISLSALCQCQKKTYFARKNPRLL